MGGQKVTSTPKSRTNVLGSMPATTSRVSNSDAVSSGVRVSDMSSRADISAQASRVLDQENALPSCAQHPGQEVFCNCRYQ